MRFSSLLVFVFQILSAQNIFQSAEIVIEAFGERLETKTHLTPHLLDIAKNGHLLDTEKKEELKNLGFNFNQSLVNRSGAQRTESRGLDRYYDKSYFRIHYTSTGRNAVDPTDQNSNNIPDYIETIAETFETVSSSFHNQMGFVLPPSDGAVSYTHLTLPTKA